MMGTVTTDEVAAADGGEHAWVAWYRSHYAELVRLAVLLVDDHGLAEEIVQDVFVAIGRIDRTESVDTPLPYLRRAVVNGARSTLRRRRVRRRHLRSIAGAPTAPPADAEIDRSVDAAQIMHAVGALPRRQREVLVLRYWNDLSEAEIADARGISVGSVKTHAHRGIARLAELVEDVR